MKNVKKARIALLLGIAVALAVVFMACPTEAATECTVTFTDTNRVAPDLVVKVDNGKTVSADDVKFAFSVDTPQVALKEGLYKDGQDVVPATLGYNNGSSTNALFQFGVTKITKDTTVNTTWTAEPVALGSSGTEIAGAVTTIKTATGKYLLVLNKDVTAAAQVLDVSNVDLTIVGLAQERKITLNSATGTLFTVGKAGAAPADGVDPKISLTLGDKITLTGVSGNTQSLVQVLNKASLTMLTGSKITGNTSSAVAEAFGNTAGGSTLGQGAAVHIGVGARSADAGTGGTFNLRGGEISGNTGSTANNMVVGGLYADSGSTINLESGKISGNNGAASAEKNIYVTQTVIVNLKGATEIKDITLNAQLATDNATLVNGRITVGDFTSTVKPIINLRGYTPNLTGNSPSVAAWWLTKPVLEAATGATLDVSKFVTGDFYSQDASQKATISTTHKLSATGTLIANS